MPITKKSKYYYEGNKTGTNLYLTIPIEWKAILEYIVLNEKIIQGGRVRQRDIATDLMIGAIKEYIKKHPNVYDKVKDILKGESL